MSVICVSALDCTSDAPLPSSVAFLTPFPPPEGEDRSVPAVPVSPGRERFRKVSEGVAAAAERAGMRTRGNRVDFSALLESPVARQPTGDSPLKKKGKAKGKGSSQKSLAFPADDNVLPCADDFVPGSGGGIFGSDGSEGEDSGKNFSLEAKSEGKRRGRKPALRDPNPDPEIVADGAVNVGPDLADPLRLYTIQRDGRSCSCGILCQLKVNTIFALCEHFRIETSWKGENGDLSRRRKPKNRLLLALCMTCESLEEVETAKVNKGFRDNIHPRFWNPTDPSANAASIMDGFYLIVLRADLTALGVTADETEAVRADILAFRAHFAKAMSINFKFYVIKGRKNKENSIGQVQVVLSEDRCSNFVHAMNAAFDHYHDVHDWMTCGRLRKGKVCTPFKLLSTCHRAVHQVMRDTVQKVLAFVLDNHTTIMSIEAPFPEQEQLRRHFGM